MRAQHVLSYHAPTPTTSRPRNTTASTGSLSHRWRSGLFMDPWEEITWQSFFAMYIHPRNILTELNSAGCGVCAAAEEKVAGGERVLGGRLP